MRVDVVVSGRLVVAPEYSGQRHDSEAEIEGAFDRTMEELLVLGVTDPLVGGSLATGEIEISFTTEAEGSSADAISAGDSAARTALHAAGIGTAEWATIDRHFCFEWEETRATRSEDAEVVAS